MSLINLSYIVQFGYYMPISATRVMCRVQGQKPIPLHKKAVISFITFVLYYSFIKLLSPTVINCTTLTVDPSGPLRMSSCDNHYGSKCNFSCMIGYGLNGTSAVTCVSPGNQHPGVWNNTIPTCEGNVGS